ncbi:MAG: hypothetical protein WD534_03010 [Phycisphaeraceae bacterium]
MRDPLQKVFADWAKLGVLYGVTPTRRTPDVEALLLRTAEVLPTFARLLPTTVTWLAQYERLVCRHRLARLAGDITEAEVSAALGLVLDFARQHTQSDHLNIAIAVCRPADEGRPLFAIDQRSAAFKRLAEAQASTTARRWNLWTPAPTLKPDAIRPATWLMKRNPTLRYRAIFGGNLRVSILVTLLADPEAGRSESALARACGVTRKAVREALDHLAFCGLVSREADGARTRAVLEPSNLAA